MKSFLCIIFALLFLGNTALKAQYYDHAIGIRGGTSLEFSYKKFIFYHPNIQQAVESLIGFQADENVPIFAYDKPIHNGFVTEGLWVLHLDLGFDTNFSGYAGAGVYFGIYTETALNPAFFGGGFTAAVGVEYTFSHVPISIGLDWKPILGYPRFSLARGALTFRYILPTTWQ
jgi:hypothetical protein